MSKKNIVNDKMTKVIYFDEESSIDYINIKAGGVLSRNQEEEKSNESKGEINTGANAEAGFSLFKFLKGGVKGEVDAEILQYGKNIVKSSITNTILTDFINRAENDRNIRKFTEFKIFPIENSLTYWKLYTPYTIIFKDKFSDAISPEIDLRKLDELIDNVKGYYELLADDEKEKVIMRFNNNGFKNNYKLSNLLNMNLTYYGVKVGESTLERYSVENEFDFLEKNITPEEIKGQSNEKNKIKIFDIFLAGVVVNE